MIMLIAPFFQSLCSHLNYKWVPPKLPDNIPTIKYDNWLAKFQPILSPAQDARRLFYDDEQ